MLAAKRLAVGTIVALAAALAVHAGHVAAQEAVGVGVGDTVLSLSGQAPPDSFITVSENGAAIGTLTADSSGAFSRDFPAQQPGITDLRITALDTDGVATDTASLQVNLQEHFPTSVHVFLPATLRLSSTALALGEDLQVSGQTIPDGSVTVTLDSSNSFATVAGSDGKWQLSISSDQLTPGSHNLFAVVHDGNGAQSYPTSSRTFVVLAPSTPSGSTPAPVTKPSIPAVPIIHSPADGSAFTTGSVTIAGTGPKNTQIEVWNGSGALGSVWSDSSGHWIIQLGFLPGRHSVRARSCATNGCSRFSPFVSFAYNSPSSPTPPLNAILDTYSLSSFANNPTRIFLHVTKGIPPYTVTVQWGDGATTRQSFSGRGAELKHSYDYAGHYSGLLTVKDKNGSRKLHFTVNVSARRQSSLPSLWWLLAVLAALLVYWLAHHRSRKRKKKK